MNGQRLLLHLIALAALTAATGVSLWFAKEEWRKAHPQRPRVVRSFSTGAPMAPDANGKAVMSGVQAYYKVNGYWPKNWKEVRDSLIFQRDLTSIDGKNLPIDPDDRTMNFPGDVVYNPGIKPTIQTTSTGGAGLVANVFPPLPYSRSLTILENRGHQEFASGSFYVTPITLKASDFLSDKNRLVQLAILSQLRDLAQHSGGGGGSALPNLKNILRQPASPIDGKSINPVTGKPFKFDGSPNDVWVHYGNEGPVSLVPILEDGARPVYWITP